MKCSKLIAAVLALSVICGGAAPFAEEKATTGKIGDNITWTLDSNGTLTISGTGKMFDYFYFDDELSAFSKDKRITSVIIENGVTSIGNSMFYTCSSLKSITIPDSVTSIGVAAFYNCTSLESITIPDSVTIIRNGAFSGCSSLRSMVIPDSVTDIGNMAFSDCISLESITLPDSVSNIGEGAFYCCPALISIALPDSVPSISDAAFFSCYSLESITIPDSVTNIGIYAFCECISLESITILNPECEIYDDKETITHGVIKGYEDSTAQAYAEKYNRKFESLGAAPENTETESGDLNDDGKIDANDATLVLVNYSLLSTGEPIQLTESQQKAADVNGDGKIDSSDATTILQYYSYLSTGGKDSFADFLAK